jgi:hypothetical protein
MGIFDRINVATLPAVHPLLYLAFDIELRPAELGQPFKLKITLVDADGKKALETEAEMKIDGSVASGEAIRIPQLIAFGGLPLQRAGRYSFDIFLNGDHKRAATFDVATVSGSQGAAAGGSGLRP